MDRVTISGIELAEKIKKGQFKTGKLGGCHATMSELWNAAPGSLSPIGNHLTRWSLTDLTAGMSFAPEPISVGQAQVSECPWQLKIGCLLVLSSSMNYEVIFLIRIP